MHRRMYEWHTAVRVQGQRSKITMVDGVRAGKVPCGWSGMAVVLGAEAEEMEMVFLGKARKQRADSQGTGKRESNWVPTLGRAGGR